MNDEPTHYSILSAPTAIRQTKNIIKPPRFRIVRNYTQMDQEHFRALLYQSPLLQEAALSQDINDITEYIITSVTQALDTTAPARRIQIVKKLVDYRSNDTKLAQENRDHLQNIAHTTNLEEDWIEFRHSRNQVRQFMKNDKYNYNK